MRCSLQTTLSLALLVSLAAACGMPDEESTPPGIKPDAGQLETGIQPSGLEPPALDPIPSTVCVESLPLRGTARPGSHVFVLGGALPSGLTTDAHPSTGRFCLDIPLNLGVTNTLSVQALVPGVGESEANVLTVTQRACQTEDTGEHEPSGNESVNAVQGVWPITSVEADEGDRTALTDGDPNTVAVYTGYWSKATANIWISLDLGESKSIERIVIRWRDHEGKGTAFATWYKLLTAEVSEPGDPRYLVIEDGMKMVKLDNPKWTELVDISEGNGCLGGTCGADLHEVDPAMGEFRHVALWLGHDGSTWGFGGEEFAIAEIEVWTRPSGININPGDQVPTCANQGEVY